MSKNATTLQMPKSGRVTELFPYEMPFHAARVIACFLILVFAILLAGTIFIDYPETVTAPFVLLPESGADPMQSPFDGVVEEVRVVTGAVVSKGDILYVLRSPRILELVAELRGLEKDLASIDQEQGAAEATYRINREIGEAEIVQREKEATFRHRYLTVYDDVNMRIEKLGAAGLTSSIEVLNHQLGYAEAERDAALADEAHKMSKLSLSRLDAEHGQDLKRMESESSKLTVRIAGISGQLKQATGDLAFLAAPYDGTIVSVDRKRVGDVVGVGQELCQIAPGGAPPRAHLQLEERGMARLREGQPVKLLFEAFPYQRYGVVDASLVWLSPAAILSDGEERFIAHVVPEALEIGAGENAQPLRAGMRGEARIQVGRRTLIEFAFQPIRQLRENMRNQGGSEVEEPGMVEGILNAIRERVTGE